MTKAVRVEVCSINHDYGYTLIKLTAQGHRGKDVYTYLTLHMTNEDILEIGKNSLNIGHCGMYESGDRF